MQSIKEEIKRVEVILLKFIDTFKLILNPDSNWQEIQRRCEELNSIHIQEDILQMSIVRFQEDYPRFNPVVFKMMSNYVYSIVEKYQYNSREKDFGSRSTAFNTSVLQNSFVDDFQKIMREEVNDTPSSNYEIEVQLNFRSEPHTTNIEEDSVRSDLLNSSEPNQQPEIPPAANPTDPLPWDRNRDHPPENRHFEYMNEGDPEDTPSNSPQLIEEGYLP